MSRKAVDVAVDVNPHGCGRQEWLWTCVPKHVESYERRLRRLRVAPNITGWVACHWFENTYPHVGLIPDRMGCMNIP
jgi:hypothetical protein